MTKNYWGSGREFDNLTDAQLLQILRVLIPFVAGLVVILLLVVLL